ncbi:MAG: hypothetical protein P4M06_21410 [Pandoraea sp.]|nr:hypothetical protein [Pandoraea sp.]MDR3400109.1 hypothetical protein [Pandoraea sp.]
MSLFRFDWYGQLRARAPELLEDAGKLADTLGIPDELRGRFGISASNSSAPGLLRAAVRDAIVETSGEYLPLNRLGDEIRRVVKSVYGDDFDAAPINSAEAGLAVVHDALIAPSLIGRGEPPRARTIVPYERHIEHHGSYGRPFPGIYKDIFADRGATAGELGLSGRRAENVDTVFVKLTGARYDVHGIKSYVCPLLVHVNPEASLHALEHAASVHASDLAGFATLGYDTPGCGYGVKDENGVSRLHRGIGALAAKFGVPYIADNAWGTPFLGTDPRRIGAQVMIYSTDKVMGGPTGGLIIGREDVMINVRRALGLHSERFGSVSSHGKGSHIAFDPGKEALTGTLAALRLLRDDPEPFVAAVDTTWDIVLDEFSRAKGRLKPGILLTRSLNAGGVEINYQDTWRNGEFGIPIFSHEDRIAQTNLFNNALVRAGVAPNIADDANIFITPGAGTLDANGRVQEDRLRLAVRTVFETLILLQQLAERIEADALRR